MRIKIKSSQVAARQITRARDNKQFTFHEQQGLVAMGEEVRAIVVGLEQGQAAYPPGEYEVLDSSFFVDRNGHLAVGRLALKPVASVASAATRVAG